MRRTDSTASSSSERRPPASAASGSVANVAILVIGLGAFLNLMNLTFLTTDKSSTHDYHAESIAAALGFGRGGKYELRIKDDDEEVGSGSGDGDGDGHSAVDGRIEGDGGISGTDGKVAGHRRRDEILAFKSILTRAISNLERCNALPKLKGRPSKELVRASNVSLLSEFGIVNALSEWIATAEHDKGNEGEAAGSSAAGGTSAGAQQQQQQHPPDSSYPICHLPPPTSCHTQSYSAVLMSHAVDRLKQLMQGITDIAARPATEEIILVWNSPRSVLESDTRNGGKTLLEWDGDAAHKLRIFFALENGLENNLLNRYHPSIRPKSEAVMYFDDDGPFFDERPMSDVGLELWRRNSDVQVGCFPRNLRFTSDRMKTLQRDDTERIIRNVVEEGRPGRAGGDGGAEAAGDDGNDDDDEKRAHFVPTCRERTGDIIEYNYFVFPQFGAHMLLPSGSFLHRNFLCFIWHPALSDLRRFVRDHPTHPDDQTISAIVSQLSGRAPRVFPRNVHPPAGGSTGDRNGGKVENATKVTSRRRYRRLLGENYATSISDEVESEAAAAVGELGADRYHRRLLWKQKNWGPMREEAANSIVGYFGSVNPGSVGWCTGTDHQKKKRRAPGGYDCDPEFPTLDQVPWVNAGGIGHDQC